MKFGLFLFSPSPQLVVSHLLLISFHCFFLPVFGNYCSTETEELHFYDNGDIMNF